MPIIRPSSDKSCPEKYSSISSSHLSLYIVSSVLANMNMPVLKSNIYFTTMWTHSRNSPPASFTFSPTNYTFTYLCISTFWTYTKLPIKIFVLSSLIKSAPFCHGILKVYNLFLNQYYFYWNESPFILSFVQPQIETFTGFFTFLSHLNLVIVESMGVWFNFIIYFFIFKLLFLLFFLSFIAFFNMAQILC